MAFITEIANYIKGNYDLSKESLTIIFPNKRAALKLRMELMKSDYKKNVWLPQILSCLAFRYRVNCRLKHL